MKPIIEVDRLTKTFGSFTAVNGISFDIRKGEILGFIGPNGAGKTTTIKMIIGLLRISGGRVLINGMDAARNRRRLKRDIGYMSQKFSLYPTLTAEENAVFFGGVSGLTGKALRTRVRSLKEWIPGHYLQRQTEDMPPGIRQNVALFVCLLTNPDIIFLDEPTSGVDPEVRRRFWQDIYRLKQQGKTLLVSTHNLEEVEYCDRVLIIHRGDLIAEGEPSRLRRDFSLDNMEDIFKVAIENHEADLT
ncbi:MAG: ABC transporter ATP-binding protein [Candidatus Aminicenantes bacterium]|nr:ABC transporter ATP-binding protein [Candidatus Aminicenantes bacterium]